VQVKHTTSLASGHSAYEEKRNAVPLAAWAVGRNAKNFEFRLIHHQPRHDGCEAECRESKRGPDTLSRTPSQWLQPNWHPAPRRNLTKGLLIPAMTAIASEPTQACTRFMLYEMCPKNSSTRWLRIDKRLTSGRAKIADTANMGGVRCEEKSITSRPKHTASNETRARFQPLSQVRKIRCKLAGRYAQALRWRHRMRHP
jgi:hypothetical protein